MSEKILGALQQATDAPAPGAKALPLHWHGDQPITAPKWLVRYRLPMTGVALISGQWGTGKTFVFLDLSAAVMTGGMFLGQPVRRRGGVLLIAPEAAYELPTSLAALAEAKIAALPPLQLELGQAAPPQPLDPAHLPFVWVKTCPPLLADDCLEILVATAKEATAALATMGFELALIGIDTLAAAAAFRDENASAEVTRALGVLHALSEETRALVAAIDHYGKDTNAGSRESSAKEDRADNVLALLGDRAPNGTVTNRRVGLRKVRGEKNGLEFPFELQVIDLGKDENGDPMTSCVVDWVAGAAREKPSRAKSPPRANRLLVEAMAAALEAHGAMVLVPGNGKLPQQAVRRERVAAEYKQKYGGEAKNAREALTKAIKRQTEIEAGLVGGEEYLWYRGDRGL